MRPLNHCVLFIAIVAVGWGLWSDRMGVNDHDDALSNELLFAANPATRIVTDNPWPDQSPVYFLLLHAVRRAGQSPFAIQLLNAALLTLTLAATYALGLALTGSRAVALGAVCLGALSPASLWLVRSGRMYSIQLPLSMLGILAVASYRDRQQQRDLVAFSVLCILNIYNHFIGFLITAVLVVALLVGQIGGDDRSRGTTARSRTLVPLALAVAAIAVLAFPQLLRLISLVHTGAPRHPLSLPALSLSFLDRVVRFWFVNVDSSRARTPGALLPIYLAGAGILTVAGVAAMPRHHRFLVASCLVVPLISLGLIGSWMDVRERYFAWVLPLLWIAVAAGALGSLPWDHAGGAGPDAMRGFRRAIALAVAAASLWFTWIKLPERYPQWTKLMTGLEAIYRPSMSVYMPPGPPTGTPRFLASYLGAPAGLADIEPLSRETRERFLDEVGGGREFVFLVQSPSENAELGWRERYLQDHGFHRGVLQVWGARAELFTHREAEGFTRQQHLEADQSPAGIVAWARHRLEQRTAPPPAAQPRLRDALVASVKPDGTIDESVLFISQNGEDGSWMLSAKERDAVNEGTAVSRGVERAVVAAQPRPGSILVMAFPGLEMRKSVSLIYGLTDSSMPAAAGSGARLALYVDGAPMGEADSRDAPGWHELVADSSTHRNTAGDVVVLIENGSATERELALRVTSSTLAAPRFGAGAPAAGEGVTLTGGHTLREYIDQLAVYRLSGESRIEPRHAVGTHSAGEMHEAAGSAGEGAVRTHWILGPLAWDAVGLTRQQSGGIAREGIWAHPRGGTTLVVETPAAAMGHGLHGYAGLTDFAVARSAQLGVTEPVRLRIAVDGGTVIERDVARVQGWQMFDSRLSSRAGSRTLRIEISSSIDSWAHFVFDLWAE